MKKARSYPRFWFSDGLLQGGEYCVAHFGAGNEFRAFFINVAGAQALLQHFLDGVFDLLRAGFVVQAVTQQHGEREDGGKWVGFVLSGDVGSGAV